MRKGVDESVGAHGSDDGLQRYVQQMADLYQGLHRRLHEGGGRRGREWRLQRVRENFSDIGVVNK